MEQEPSFGQMTDYLPAERELLRAVRALVRADQEMRAALRSKMGLGEKDLKAIRFVMAAGGNAATPHDLARHLGISTAATTTLLDRLAKAGHVERAAHPTDRRSKVLVPTAHAYEEVRQELTAVHERMRSAARAVPAAARPAVVSFLQEMAEVMQEEAGDG